jgi:hypothetical protein
MSLHYVWSIIHMSSLLFRLDNGFHKGYVQVLLFYLTTVQRDARKFNLSVNYIISSLEVASQYIPKLIHFLYAF